MEESASKHARVVGRPLFLTAATATAASTCASRVFLYCLVFQGELPALAEVDEILEFIEKIGVDVVALDGGFVPPDIGGGSENGISSTAATSTAAGAEEEEPSKTADAAADTVAATM